MVGQTFTRIGRSKLIFRLVIARIDCVRGITLDGSSNSRAFPGRVRPR
jgi:hypothetical protein